jgi:hypothetical protein
VQTTTDTNQDPALCSDDVTGRIRTAGEGGMQPVPSTLEADLPARRYQPREALGVGRRECRGVFGMVRAVISEFGVLLTLTQGSLPHTGVGVSMQR